MIQKRLANGIDKHIHKMQYGFRKGRSTSQPLFLCRRIQDLSEAFKKKLTLVFLDWEKAFDNIYQDELINALRRMSIPEEMLEIIKQNHIREPTI